MQAWIIRPGCFVKKGIIVLLIIFISAFYLIGQEVPVLISGSFKKAPLKSFIAETEQKYKFGKFFYEENLIDSITVTGTFHEISLKKCLEQIFEKKQLNFYILKNNQVVIYQGSLLSNLFNGSELRESDKEVSSPEKGLPREKLLQLQYQIINIGIPGNNNARTATLSGYLKNFDSGDPIAGGNVFVTEIQKGVSSDAAGYYIITLPVGNQIVNFSCIGMEPVKRNINLYSDGRLDVDMEVRMNLMEGAVVIGHGEGTLGQIHIGMEKIDIKNIRSIPTLLGEADVMKSVLTMPGVQTVGEGTSGFNVRGGNTDQNLILIDQATIYYPSHFFGNFSAINSEVIENATLYKGSMPVRYGGRISSVFEINTISGNREKLSGSAGISPVSARVNLNGPLFSKNSTFMTSFRSTYSNWLLSRIEVPELYKSKAGFYDAQAKLTFRLDAKSDLLVNFYNSNDKFQLHNDTTYKYKNTIGSLTLKA